MSTHYQAPHQYVYWGRAGKCCEGNLSRGKASKFEASSFFIMSKNSKWHAFPLCCNFLNKSHQLTKGIWLLFWIWERASLVPKWLVSAVIATLVRVLMKWIQQNLSILMIRFLHCYSLIWQHNAYHLRFSRGSVAAAPWFAREPCDIYHITFGKWCGFTTFWILLP